ncbi:hypothetical protein ASPZODRAFT_16378 [Penicilliopsis zonata CBS 506.65]|uniref:Diaminohydroxyphosphoribosylamino-pyrimidine deaminase n=1 Tax=Penicilliopsis zonata CBS 506.65 TaxID=1073090 RepID=A0A1L9SHD3_9EURO|nr:hypothetical protein ASPZODRAFT_16378 [Penicilliopsis zonata CBS 506.65]OJJ46622.1 hypothetical protein ASPZODRAFT_16378 [Penicilliopsis zonata CBS 506.65]
MTLVDILNTIGTEVEDAEEESFLLFSQDIPSSNLGFVDSRASSVEITINETEYTIRQSPTILSSARGGGTTGAVLWKITPRLASWLTSPNPLWKNDLLTSSSAVVELGCGISPLVGLSVGSRVGSYLATDQEYVRKLFMENITQNTTTTMKTRTKTKTKSKHASTLSFTSLDWERDDPSSLSKEGFDLLLSCDCVYNEALVKPFVRTCADICRLRSRESDSADHHHHHSRPTLCLIAQQQRVPDVFETWLKETMHLFRVWRLEDHHVLGSGLGLGSGYLLHLLVLKTAL